MKLQIGKDLKTDMAGKGLCDSGYTFFQLQRYRITGQAKRIEHDKRKGEQETSIPIRGRCK